MLEKSKAGSYISTIEDPRQRLAACLLQASYRAHEADRPVLVRVHIRLSACEDPWSTVTPFLSEDAPYFLWNDGSSELCVAAVGALQSCDGNPGDQFPMARDFSANFSEHITDINWDDDGESEVDADVPFAFSSFTFDDGQPLHPWEGWSGGTTMISPLMIYRRKDSRGSSAVLQLLVEDFTDLGDEFAACERLIRSLRGETDYCRQVEATEILPHIPKVVGNMRKEKIAWECQVNQALEAINLGSLDKVVLARRADFAAPCGTAFDAQGTIHALRRAHPRSISFAISRGDGACFLGASPEVLARVSGHQLRTHAVAGTIPRGASKAEDLRLGKALLQSVKDRFEHELVAGALQATLAPFCSKLERSSTPQLLRLPRLQHLETIFRATLKHDYHILDVVERLHPTPAVGGWPTIEAQKWLAKHEALSRGLYAGPIGWTSASGDGVFAVAIRSVLLTDASAYAFVGAGIVADSNPHAEWKETGLKLQTINEALKLRPHFHATRTGGC